MSSLQIYTTTAEALMNEAMSFKNKIISKKEFNEKMVTNLTFLLSSINNPKNKKIESQDLDFFLPISHLSYTLETQMKSDDYISNSFDNNHKNSYESNKEETPNEIQFEETPIIQSNNSDFFSVFYLDDDLTFNNNEDSDTTYLQDNHISELKIIEKKIEVSWYSDESCKKKNSSHKREINGRFSPLKRLNVKKPNDNKKKKKKEKERDEIKKIQLLAEFEELLPNKVILHYCNMMNGNYLRYMLFHFLRIKETAEKSEYFKDKKVINLMKGFLLEIGLADKKIYEDSLRSMFYKNTDFNFEIFLSCFNKVLHLEEDCLFVKYKFLFYIIQMKKEEDVNVQHIRKFMELIQCKQIYNEEVFDAINDKLVEKYIEIYGGNGIRFKIRELMLVLENILENR